MNHKKPSFRTLVFAFYATLFLMTGIFLIDSQIGLFHTKHPEAMQETEFASKSKHHLNLFKFFKRGYGSHKCHQQNKNCFTENFQAPIGESGAVDILFVLQTSPSLLSERSLIVAEINAFIATLPEESDFNIAVMLSHGSTSDLSGRLFRVDSEPIVLKSSALTNAQLQAALTAKLTSAPQDPDSGGGEEGLFSLFRGITTPALLAESQTAGFFRPEAALGIVYIADQRDICAPVSSGAPAETDPVKIAARIRDCEGLTPQGLSNRLTTLKGTSEVDVSGIIYVDSPVPADAENELGFGYIEAINLDPGIAIDLANDDISEALSPLLELGGQQSVPQNSFTLSHSNVNSASVRIQVNGQDVPFQLQGEIVTVTQPIPSGATVVITYCVKSNGHSYCKHKHGLHSGHHHGFRCDKDDTKPNHGHHHNIKKKYWDLHDWKNDIHKHTKNCKHKSHNSKW